MGMRRGQTICDKHYESQSIIKSIHEELNSIPLWKKWLIGYFKIKNIDKSLCEIDSLIEDCRLDGQDMEKKMLERRDQVYYLENKFSDLEEKMNETKDELEDSKNRIVQLESDLYEYTN